MASKSFLHRGGSQMEENSDIEKESLISETCSDREVIVVKVKEKKSNKSSSLCIKALVLLILCVSVAAFTFRETLVLSMFGSKESSTGLEERQYKTPAELLDDFLYAKSDFDKLLHEDYGEYMYKIFNKTTIMSAFKGHDPKSMERLKLRMKIKILNAQLHQSTRTSYIWATGGHSAAAAHGNIFNQSYSSSLEQSASGPFRSLGIRFYGKNYAMGGTLSGPEVAMCMSSIFGNDIDALSWDYGMTDGRNDWLYSLWAQRAGSHPTFPSIFSLFSDRNYLHNEFVVKNGMSAFDIKIDELRDNIPDSNNRKANNSTEFPRGIKDYICDGHVESPPESGCGKNKWDTERYCEKVQFQTSWHNGWHDHLFIGRVLAVFLVQNLMDALIELKDGYNYTQSFNSTSWEDDIPSPAVSVDYLKYLRHIESQNKQSFVSSPFPKNSLGMFDQIPLQKFKIFQRNKAYCQTALLPAELRFDGIVTQSGHKGNYEFSGYSSGYDEGHEKSSLPNPNPNDNSTKPMLTFEKSFRLLPDSCEARLEIDFKDYFTIREADEWMTMVVPSKAHLNSFKVPVEKKPTTGLIMMCTRNFDWGRFPESYVFIENIQEVDIEINGVMVTEAISVSTENRCQVLKHGNSYLFPKLEALNNDFQYEIKFNVRKQKGILYLSSVIVL
eukprot:CAMPEP_0184858144 /NCGR_PEP_ID=MMETSP0580-20130426/3266_1 /TAXON_ID=1118495 /ORGANISM="Dactyliosolen fragilissimus" /LENGTH=667 /DNA_ID=CAMNT_0027354127 /DNA_START=63 /DNA_END=2066 /DNA_ORIENTATION=-